MMSTIEQSPTPYPDVNATLQTILDGAQTVLGSRLVGMYVDGSLALGDFDEHESDIDFLVVTNSDVTGDTFTALQAMHAQFAASGSRWATEIEGSYLSQQALRRFDPAQTWFPRIQRGADESLRMEEHASDWVIHRAVLRDGGITLAGPAPQTLIDPVDPHDLRQAMTTYMRHPWWQTLLADPSQITTPGYQRYVILTLCRVRYTLAYGTVVSKPVAAQWAASRPARRWKDVIERARWSSSELRERDIHDTLELVQDTITCSLDSSDAVNG